MHYCLNQNLLYFFSLNLQRLAISDNVKYLKTMILISILNRFSFEIEIRFNFHLTINKFATMLCNIQTIVHMKDKYIFCTSYAAYIYLIMFANTSLKSG